jgi:hypothetical protein
MGSTAAGIAVFGTLGALIGAIPILFFGVSAAPAPSPGNWESGIFRVLGPFDSLGATANGVRNGIFFGAASQAQNLEVLPAWTVVPLVVLLALGWRGPRAVRTTAKGTSGPPPVELQPAA